jgi:hypothetical protein
MSNLPTPEQIYRAKQNNVWDFGNKFLYDLCLDIFYHYRDDCILTKVLFIGRIYASAVERRRNNKGVINDDFYINTVAPTLKRSKLDKYLEELKAIKSLNADDIKPVLQAHFYLADTLNKITDLNKRSFCSKYLHFHLSDLFFIYDSRAVSALRHFTKQVPKNLIPILEIKDIDTEYAKFYCKCFEIKRQIEKSYNTTLTIRQFDNLLIDVANKRLAK